MSGGGRGGNLGSGTGNPVPLTTSDEKKIVSTYTFSSFFCQLSFFVTAYCLPLLLIIVLYSVMLHRLWNTAPGGRASAESIKNKKRVIRMVLIVVVCFALSWLPIHVVLVLRALGKYAISPVSITFQVA